MSRRRIYVVQANCFIDNIQGVVTEIIVVKSIELPDDKKLNLNCDVKGQLRSEAKGTARRPSD